MRLVMVHVLLLAIGCAGGGSSSLLPGKKPSEVPGPALGSYDGGADLGAEQLEAAAPPAPPADGPNSPPADAAPPPPPPPADAAPPPPDASPIPLRPDGRPYPACAPFDVTKTSWLACGDNKPLGSPDRVFQRTVDGFVCEQGCDRAQVGTQIPCWLPAPTVGDYTACRRPWLCVNNCGDCPVKQGPSCEVQP